MTEILYQIALIVLILAGVMLIYVLYLVSMKLNDLGDIAKVVNKRVHDADDLITTFERALNGISDAIKNFTDSYEKVVTTKDKIKSFFNNVEKIKK